MKVKDLRPRGASRSSSPIAVKARGELHRSTAELSGPQLEVRQHHGIGNKSPPILCERALLVCLKRWRRYGQAKTERLREAYS